MNCIPGCPNPPHHSCADWLMCAEVLATVTVPSILKVPADLHSRHLLRCSQCSSSEHFISNARACQLEYRPEQSSLAYDNVRRLTYVFLFCYISYPLLHCLRWLSTHILSARSSAGLLCNRTALDARQKLSTWFLKTILSHQAMQRAMWSLEFRFALSSSRPCKISNHSNRFLARIRPGFGPWSPLLDRRAGVVGGQLLREGNQWCERIEAHLSPVAVQLGRKRGNACGTEVLIEDSRQAQVSA